MIVTGKSKDSSNTQKEEPNEFTFFVEGRPIPKGRPRMSRKGRVYTPKETVIAEKSYIGAAVDAPRYEGQIEVEVEFCEEGTYITVIPVEEWKTKLRGDLDNYIKLCLDGLQRAEIIENDRSVVKITAVKT